VAQKKKKKKNAETYPTPLREKMQKFTTLRLFFKCCY